MKRFLTSAAKWFRHISEEGRTPAARQRARLTCERLEGREVLSVSYGGGPLLQNVQVQNIFYGADYYYNPTYYQSAVDLTNVTNDLTQSSYADMLGEYGVGRGGLDGATINYGFPSGRSYLDDSYIRQMISDGINAGALMPPSANQLYVVFTEPNVTVTFNGGSSLSDFTGYHSYIPDPSLGILYYAVIAHPVGNYSIPGLNWFQAQTKVLSHELAEAATNPDVVTGWRDYSQPLGSGEIGDLCNNYLVAYHGYVVQPEYLNSLGGCAYPYDGQYIGSYGPQAGGGAAFRDSKAGDTIAPFTASPIQPVGRVEHPVPAPAAEAPRVVSAVADFARLGSHTRHHRGTDWLGLGNSTDLL